MRLCIFSRGFFLFGGAPLDVLWDNGKTLSPKLDPSGNIREEIKYRLETKTTGHRSVNFFEIVIIDR